MVKTVKELIINRNQSSHCRFYIGLSVILFVVFCRNVLNLPIPVGIVLGLHVLLAFTCSEDELVSLFICYIPLEASFQFKYGILACAILLLIKKSKKKISLTSGLYLLIMIIWELLHIIIGDFSLIEFFRSFAEMFFLLVVLMDKKEYDFHFISRNLVNTTLFIGISMLLNLLIRFNFDFSGIFLLQNYRLGQINESVEISVLNYNPNQLGFIFALSIMAEFILITKKKPKLFDYIEISLLFFLGLLTKSRSFAVTVICIFIIFFVIRRKNSISKKAKTAFLSLALFILLYVLVEHFAPYVLEQFSTRFMEEDISSGRINLFNDFNRLILDNSLVSFFGLGLQNVLLKVQHISNNTINQIPHNGIQEILVLWGVPGLLFFVLFIRSLIKNNMVKNEIVLRISVLLISFVSCLFGQLITNSTKLMTLTYALVLMRYNFSREINND